jgi:hypothetical protein
MNIKENCYIYQFKQLNELIEEQENKRENDNQNSMLDILIRHEYTPQKRHVLHNTRQFSALKHSKRETTRHHNDTGSNAYDKFQINSGLQKYNESMYP